MCLFCFPCRGNIWTMDSYNFTPMIYQERKPHLLLAPYVKCLWMVEADEQPDDAEDDRVMPDGCLEMIFHYGDRFQLVRSGQREEQARSFVFGQIQRFMDMRPTGKTGMIAVRFHPFGLEVFLKMPIIHLNEQSVDVGDLFGAEGRVLEARIVEASSFEDRAQLIEQFLISKLRGHQADPLIMHTIQRMTRTHGLTSMEALALEHRLSVRTLERRFRQSAGLTPKTLSRILRFQHVFNLAESQRFTSLTQLALEAGYYDQAHFIREFRDFSGMTPSAYFSNDHRFTDYFTGLD